MADADSPNPETDTALLDVVDATDPNTREPDAEPVVVLDEPVIEDTPVHPAVAPYARSNCQACKIIGIYSCGLWRLACCGGRVCGVTL